MRDRRAATSKVEIWLIFSRSLKSPQGLVLVAQDCWCHTVHWEGLHTDKYLSMCEWRKRDDSQPVSCVWSRGIKRGGPAQWHRVTQAKAWTHTHILSLSLSLSVYSHQPPSPPLRVSQIALSANSCQRHHPLGTVASFVHTVIRQLASSAFSCLYLDNSLHPNELCQNGIWHKPSIKHSWQTLKVQKSMISLDSAPRCVNNSQILSWCSTCNSKDELKFWSDTGLMDIADVILNRLCQIYNSSQIYITLMQILKQAAINRALCVSRWGSLVSYHFYFKLHWMDKKKKKKKTLLYQKTTTFSQWEHLNLFNRHWR